MPAIVNYVAEYSIAEDLNILPGDEILSVNNVKPRDLLDYKHLTASEELTIEIKRKNGEVEIIDIEKDIDEELGIQFDSIVFDKIIPCTNKCIFCFVDQQPPELRESLYIKDDDYRLSYYQGTYITLTNLTEQDKKRIEDMKLGPLYVSVHTTNPELRQFMLKNPKSGNILEELKWLNSIDIPVHVQIVLCSGINDGKELERTLSDLELLKSNILSIAIVPVGITKYRQENNLSLVSKEKAIEVISQVSDFNKRIGQNLAFPSDEFYILAEQEFPDTEFYGEFGQLDDGVGTSRLLINDFEEQKSSLPEKLENPKSLTIATGKIACKALKPIIDELNKIENLKIDLIPVKSNFWGENVTVAGLIAGQDLLDNLLPIKDQISNLVIPSVMLRKHTDIFLDDLTLDDIEEALGVTVHVIEDYYSNIELIELILEDN